MNFGKIKGGMKTNAFWMHFFGVTSFFVLLFFFCQIGVKIYTRHGQGIEVPDIKGMQYSEAEYQLREMNLEVLVVDSDYVKDKPAGCVVDQSPAAGLKVKLNRTIYVTVNAASSPMLSLPDLADNSSKRQAMVKLKSMGLNIGPIETIDGEKDWVYAIKYRGRKIFAGDRIPSDATLTLVIGSGLFAGDTDSTLHFTIDDIGAYSSELDETGKDNTPKEQKTEEPKKKADDWF